MVQKALRSDSSSQNSLSPCRDWLEARGEGLPSPNRTLLATGKMGRGREWGGSASHTVSPRGWKTRRKGNLLFLTMWVPLALEPAAEQNEWFSPCPPSGEGVALSSPSPEIKQLPTSPGCLCQGRLYRLSGRYRGQLEHRGRRAPARGSTRRPTIQHGAERLWRTQEGAHGDKQTGSCSAAERCITPGQDVLPRSASVLPRTAGHSPRQCRRTVKPGRRERRESWLCRLRSSQQGWAIDGTLGPHMWTSPSRGTALRLQSLSAVPASTSGWYYPRAFNALAWCARRIALACSAEAAWPAALQALAARAAVSLQALDGRRGQFLQVAAFCRHKCTANRTLHLGNVNVTRSPPRQRG